MSTLSRESLRVHPSHIAIIALPEHLPATLPIGPAPEPDDLAEWLDCQAAHYRVGNNGASALAARMFSELAHEVRFMSATTADEFEARSEAMAEWSREQAMSPEYFF